MEGIDSIVRLDGGTYFCSSFRLEFFLNIFAHDDADVLHRDVATWLRIPVVSRLITLAVEREVDGQLGLLDGGWLVGLSGGVCGRTS